MSKYKNRTLFILTAAIVVTGLFMTVNPANVYGQDEKKCLTCHNSTELFKTTPDGAKVSLYVSQKAMSTSAHRYIDCTTCHTAEPHKVETPLTKLSLAEKCGTCHRSEYKLHLDSIHGQQLAQGNEDVATCVDCHSPSGNAHSVIRVLEYDAPTYKKNIAQTCASCHSNDELRADYGIVEKGYESYLRSFHGKAMSLGTYEISQLDKATCTNCHGVHDIKATDDPAAPVAGLDKLAKTCEQCHPGAGVEFARGFLGHKEASLENIPAAYRTEVLFTVLTRSVIAFGGLVVIAAVVRFSINRWRE